MIHFQQVVKTYTTGRTSFTAVDQLELIIKPGECCCLLGPNGAGKTTSIMMMVGFLPITEGDIQICGVSVRDSPTEARTHISYMPDEVALYANLTGMQNLRFFGDLLKKTFSRSDYEGIAKKLGLSSDALQRKLSFYSKGMIQRLAICVALLKEASVFVFDEPTSGLDAVGVRDLLQIIKSLREQGKTILVTTHDLLHVGAFASKVVFLANGKIHRSMSERELSSANLEEEYIRLVSEVAQHDAL